MDAKETTARELAVPVKKQAKIEKQEIVIDPEVQSFNKSRNETTPEVQPRRARYRGSLSLEWYNKQRSIILQDENAPRNPNDIPAPKINWVNKDQTLFYEIDEKEGKGLKPYWVDRNDLRVKEARPLVFQKAYIAQKTGEKNGKPEYAIEESDSDDPDIENMLIKGRNLLVLNSLKKIFKKRENSGRIKCIYIDIPYNTGTAFEYYEDNLENSEWLTLVRDNLILLKSLLRNDGFIFIQIDNRQVFRLKILLDEVFGEQNFINDIIWKRRGGSANPSNRLNNVTDYILCFRNSESSKLNQLFSLDDENTQQYIKTRFINELKNKKFMLAPIERNAKLGLRETLRYEYKGYTPKYGWMVSKEKLILLDTNERLHWNKNGRPNRRVFLADYKGQPISNLWTQIFVINPMSKERTGFDGGQKPEALIERILLLSTEENDIVLDCFGGTGTTFAVAQKLKRKWIGAEIGNHADTHIIPRMKSVLNGSDQSGISQSLNWQGGGAFKYYHLGPSIINPKDFNWELGRKFIEESLLASYEYTPDPQLILSNPEIFPDASWLPAVGFQSNGRRTMAAIFSLNPPEDNRDFMTPPEIRFLYEKVKAHNSPQAITIFTNRGVELALDAKPDDLEIVKIPQAIFAELEV